MVNVNDFHGLCDNDVIEKAIANKGVDGIVVISPRMSDVEPERSYWLLDRAILLPENTTLILRNCMLKLSDRCRDNFIRSANCGLGIEDPRRIQNIHIRGDGLCVLQGADHPRSTGDGGKILANPCPFEVEDLCRLADWIPEERKRSGQLEFLERHDHTYGTDFGKAGESQKGDWRNIGILLANVEHFSISGLKMVEGHGWHISLAECAYGCVEKIEFDACMSKVIDGMRMNMENQDGIDIRNGCHHISISDITGRTGDDVVALTAIAGDTVRPGGQLQTTHVMHSDWSRRDRNIHDIQIRNVTAHSFLCYTVRLLPANAKIWNVVVDGIIDTSPVVHDHGGTVLLGEPDSAYGKNYPDGLRFITVSNVICGSKRAVRVSGYLWDSVISNVVNRNPGCPALIVEKPDGIKNVQTFNLITVEE